MSQILFDQIDASGITTSLLSKDIDRISNKSFASTIVTGTVAGGATYTPDLSKGGIHVVTVSGSTFTIANPINLPVSSPQAGNTSNGIEWSLRVFNNSGGATTATFGTQYKAAGYSNPASTKSRVGSFYWDGTNHWMIGFSADL